MITFSFLTEGNREATLGTTRFTFMLHTYAKGTNDKVSDSKVDNVHENLIDIFSNNI